MKVLTSRSRGTLRLLTVFLLLVCILPGTASADIGPKPSVQIAFTSAENQTYYGTLLSARRSTGPASAHDVPAIPENYPDHKPADEFEIWKAFMEYEDPDGYYFWKSGGTARKPTHCAGDIIRRHHLRYCYISRKPKPSVSVPPVKNMPLTVTLLSTFLRQGTSSPHSGVITTLGSSFPWAHAFWVRFFWNLSLRGASAIGKSGCCACLPLSIL